MFKKINRGESQQKDNHFFPSKGKKLLLISLALFQTTTHAAWEKLPTIDNSTV